MISAVIITKNEESMIEDCLISLEFADEIIVVDTGNTDRTNEIALDHKAKIVKSDGRDYSRFRNDGLKATRGKWVLYIDADERVTPLLRTEIAQLTQYDPGKGVFAIPRTNVFLGKQMKYGGWSGDYVIRLFKRTNLVEWKNPLHEQPVYTGDLGQLENPLIHFSHRDLSSMLEKTIEYTKYESELRLQANHPQIVPWRIVRVMFSEFWYRFVKLSAWRDGVEGVIDGMFQVFNTFVIYARLWESQNAHRRT